MEAFVQMTGYVGGDVAIRGAGPTQSADFRLGSTPRVLRNGEWVDGTTTWITVKVWRQLAKNVAMSVKRGEPVIVIGRLRTSSWERDGQSYERLELDAVTVGPDLRRGQSSFQKNLRPPRPGDVEEIADDIDPETGEIRNESVGDGRLGDGRLGDGRLGDGQLGDGQLGDGQPGDGEIGGGEIGGGELGTGELGRELDQQLATSRA